MSKEINPCPEIPYFGATYPDATCVNGYLWDLDKCDENGLIEPGEKVPCPFCNKAKFMQLQKDNEENLESVESWIEKMKIKYGS